MRKGQFDWSLRNVGELVLAAMVLIFVIWIGYSLVSLFVSGNDDFSSKRMLDLLDEKIKNTDGRGSLILGLPRDRAIIAFDRGEETYAIPAGWRFKGLVFPDAPNVYFERPSSCNGFFEDSACVCVIDTSYLQKISDYVSTENQYPVSNEAYVACKRISYDSVRGVAADVTINGMFSNPSFDLPKKEIHKGMQTYGVFIDGLAPSNLLLIKDGTALLLRSAPCEPRDMTPFCT